MSNPFAKKAGQLFLFITAMGVVPFAVLILINFHTYPVIRTALRAFFVAQNELCKCESAILSSISPVYWGGAIASAGALIFFVSILAIAAFRITRQTRAFVRFHLKDDSHESVFAFCYGFFRPKVRVSPWLFNRLSIEEANVVVRHESYHQKTREPLKSFVVYLMQSVFSFIPSFSLFAEQYQTYAELAADFFATNGFRDKKHLAGALYAMLEDEAPHSIKRLPLSSFGSVTEARVRILSSNDLNCDFIVREPFFHNRTVFPLLLVPLFIAVIYSLIFFSKPFSAEGAGERMCRQAPLRGVYQCEMRVLEK